MQRTSFKRPTPPARRETQWPIGVRFADSPRCDGLAVVQPKPVEQRNPALLAMARGKRCLLCVPGICNCPPATVVACHSNFSIHGKSGARKADDQFSVWGGGPCHRWLDQGPAPYEQKLALFLAAHARQVLEWQKIAGDMAYTPKERRAAHWALCHVETP